MQSWWRSLRTCVDPDGAMRRRAGHADPFTVVFPGMAPVHFVATPAGAREILTMPRDVLCAPTPHPVEPIVGASSVLLSSGDRHRRRRRVLSSAFGGSETRRRANAMAGDGGAGGRPRTGGDAGAAISLGRRFGDASDASRGAGRAAEAVRGTHRRRHVVQAGDVVGIALPAVHFDPTSWQDPHTFRPARSIDQQPTPFEYLPFGGGYRRCPGAAFAFSELAIAIGTMMRDVTLDMTPGERGRRPPRSVPRGIATVPRREIALVVTERN